MSAEPNVRVQDTGEMVRDISRGLDGVAIAASSRLRRSTAMKVTIGIKVYNEEEKIENCLLSAVAAAKRVSGIVRVADSHSDDRTIEICSRFPIECVRLTVADQRSCGTGAQLAYQGCQTEYFYLMDGDMTINPDFLEAAITFLDGNPDYAGVGGGVVELNNDSLEYRIRTQVAATESHRKAGTVDRLDGGGLYRRSAIEQLGYFADRNLHSFEELELGLRLRKAGFKLARLPLDAVYHRGHSTPPYTLLLRRIRSRNSIGGGQLIRAALEQGFAKELKHFRQMKQWTFIYAWWLAIILGLFGLFVSKTAISSLFLLVATLFVLPIYFVARRKSVAMGIYSFTSWNVNAAGTIVGFLWGRTSPYEPIAAETMSTGIEIK